jgi:signal transduction histidine kinase
MDAAATRAARAAWPLALAGAALGLATLVLAGDARWFRLDHGWGWAQALGVAAGWALIGCGLYASRRRPRNRTGPLLCAAGCAWFAPNLMGWAAGPSWLFTGALLASGVWFPLAAHAALAAPAGRLASLPQRAAIALAYAGAALLWPLRALFIDPVDDGCFGCARNLVGVLRDPATAAALAGWSAWAALAASAPIVALAGRKLARATRHARAGLAATIVPGAALAALQGLASVDVIHSGFAGYGAEGGGLYAARAGALLLLAGGVAWGFARARRAREAVAELVAELADAPRPGTLRDALARLLADPTLTLAYWLPEQGRYGDADGRPVDLPAAGSGRAAVELRRGGERVAVLLHQPMPFAEPGLLDELLAPARLALEHERLAAAIGAQQRDLHASRARIVAVGDTARRRLERDLHDGAQQRLLSLGLALQLARAQLPPGAEADGLLSDAQAELTAAHAELREIAHGIHPAILSEEGLPAALRTLAERAPLELVIAAVPAERLPEPVEVTAYLLAADAVATAAERPAQTAVRVAVARRGDRVIVDVDVDGDGIAGRVADRREPSALEDRVAALDGRLVIATPDGAPAHIHAELPVAGPAP